VPLYDYECSNGHKEEFLEPYDSHKTDVCQVCGGLSHRIVSVPRPAVVQGGTNASYGKR
jgi:putative FmdB family regulatory protein